MGPHCRGRARPARRLARPPFNGQLPLTPRAGHARPLPRGCHRLPRRGQDPSLRTNVHGCFVGSGLDRSAGWAGVSGLGRRGGIHAARDVCGGGNSAGRIYAAPTNRSEKWRLRVVCRGGIYASRKPSAAANTPGGINPSPTHCPQTTFCMAGRRGRRPLRRLARKRLAGGARCAPPSARPLPHGCHRLPGGVKTPPYGLTFTGAL